MVHSNPFSVATLEGIVLFMCGFSEEDLSAKLVDGEAQQGISARSFKPILF